MKNITKEQKEIFLRLAGWECTGIWWNKTWYDYFEYLDSAYKIETSKLK